MVRTVDFNRLTENAKKVDVKPNSRVVDPRLFKLERNEDGNAFAVIRFLPQVEGEDTYFAMNYSHFFTENGKTYSELCPTTIGEQCPVCEANRKGWKTTYGEIEKKRKRKVRYITNILVVKDKDHPEREGKVFLFEYGEKIHKKIINVIFDNDEEGTKGYNVFDFKKGKNFKLKIKTVSDYPNYDDSEFIADPSSIGDDKKINEVDQQIHPLKEFIHTKETLKSFNELKAIFLSKISGDSDTTINNVVSTKSERKPDDADSETKPTSKNKVEETEFFMDND